MAEEATAQEAKAEESEKFDADYVKELRSENAGWRTKLREQEATVESLQKKLNAIADKDKSELERLTDEKATLETEKAALLRQVVDTARDTAIMIAATKESVIDVDAVIQLIDRTDIVVTDGQVLGVEKALKRLLKEKPYLVKAPEPPPAAGVGGQPINAQDKSVDGMFLNVLQQAQSKR